MQFKKKKAIYLQISDYVCERILLKEWTAEEKIPSIREIAVSLEVNPNTVTRTYTHLEEQGVISMHRGVGFFVTTNAFKTVLDLKKQEFFDENLPQIFRMMELLDISAQDLTKLYKERKKR